MQDVQENGASEGGHTESRGKANENGGGGEKIKRAPSNKESTQANAQIKATNNKQARETPPMVAKVSRQQPIDFSKQNDPTRPNDTAVVRIRDPVTSKVKTIYLNDSQIEELSKRHEQDKTKVTNMQQQPVAAKTWGNQSNLVLKPRQPIDLRANRDLIEDGPLLSTPAAKQQQQERPHQQQQTPESVGDNHEINNGSTHHQQPKVTTLVAEQKPKQQQQQSPRAVDDNMDKLIERHQNEKKKVDNFQETPVYYGEDIHVSHQQSINVE
jgi:hypothetical protein